ncbi:MAG: alpha/beta hydrolase [Pseudomonadota bacterium]
MTLASQSIRFCKVNDSTRLAFATTGTGPPVVRAAHWLTHLDFDLNSPVWGPWLAQLSRTNTLLRYDGRGCGLSDPAVGPLSLDAWVSDLEAVVDAAALERFALLGCSQGAAISLAYA